MAESIVERMRRQAFASTKRDVHYEDEQLTTKRQCALGAAPAVRKNTALRNVATAGTCLSAPTCSSTTNNTLFKKD